MKGSIDSIKCVFIDLLTGREWWGEERGRGGRDSHHKEETAYESEFPSALLVFQPENATLCPIISNP